MDFGVSAVSSLDHALISTLFQRSQDEHISGLRKKAEC
jgi:hypothetical protein